MVRSALLRGDDNRLEATARLEGIIRYRHKGGGQDHTSQIIVIYHKDITLKNYSKKYSITIQPTIQQHNPTHTIQI